MAYLVTSWFYKNWRNDGLNKLKNTGLYSSKYNVKILIN